MPESHLRFLRELRPYHETDSSIFVHAGYHPDLPMDDQTERALYWNHLLHELPEPHCSGKRVFVGHTPQASGAVLDLGHLVCMDTYCFGGRWLTAMDIESGQVWQADGRGHLRRQRANSLWRACGSRLRSWFAKHGAPASATPPSSRIAAAGAQTLPAPQNAACP